MAENSLYGQEAGPLVPARRDTISPVWKTWSQETGLQATEVLKLEVKILKIGKIILNWIFH